MRIKGSLPETAKNVKPLSKAEQERLFAQLFGDEAFMARLREAEEGLERGDWVRFSDLKRKHGGS